MISKHLATIGLTSSCREIAVSYGAILRAWKKEDGPERITKSNYGFEIAEGYDPESYKEHIGVRPFNDKLDGEKYILGVIEWIVFKVRSSSTVQNFFLCAKQALKSSRVKMYQAKWNIRCHLCTEPSARIARNLYVRRTYGSQTKMWHRTIKAHTKRTKVLYKILNMFPFLVLIMF